MSDHTHPNTGHDEHEALQHELNTALVDLSIAHDELAAARADRDDWRAAYHRLAKLMQPRLFADNGSKGAKTR